MEIGLKKEKSHRNPCQDPDEVVTRASLNDKYFLMRFTKVDKGLFYLTFFRFFVTNGQHTVVHFSVE